MSFRVISFLIALLAAVAIYVTARLFRKDKLTIRVFLMWMGLWFAMGFFALFPAVLDYLMRLVAMGDRLVFLFVASIIIVYIVVFYISSRISETDRKVSKLVQEIAILNYKMEEERTKEHVSRESKEEGKQNTE